MYRLKSEASFDSAHFLAGYEGKCRNLHGHRWRIIAQIRSMELEKAGQLRGMMLDFGDFRRVLGELADEYDHALIIETDSLKERTKEALLDENFRLIEMPFRPTAENFARLFFDRLQEQGFDVYEVEVYETPNNCAVYRK